MNPNIGTVQHKLAPLLVILAGIFWGIIGLFSQFLDQTGFDALQITQLRCLTAAIALLCFLLLTRQLSFLKIHWKDIRLFLGTGICSIAFFNICYFLCISHSTLSVACILLYTAPCFVTVLSCLLFRENFTRKKAIALILAFSGCILITGIAGGDGLHASWFAFMVGLGSGFGYALYSIFSRVALRKYHPLTVTTYTFIIAAITLFPFCQPLKMLQIAISSTSVTVNIALLGLLSTVLPFLLYTKGLEHMDTGKASILTFIEPIVATVLGVAIFHEPFSTHQIFGILLIIFSIAILNGRFARKSPACMHR